MHVELIRGSFVQLSSRGIVRATPQQLSTAHGGIPAMGHIGRRWRTGCLYRTGCVRIDTRRLNNTFMLHPEKTEEETKKKEKEERRKKKKKGERKRRKEKEKEERRKKKKKEERRSAKLGNTEEYEDIRVCGEPRDVPCGNPI